MPVFLAVVLGFNTEDQIFGVEDDLDSINHHGELPMLTTQEQLVYARKRKIPQPVW